MKKHILLLLIAGTITQLSHGMTQDPNKKAFDIVYLGDRQALKDLFTRMPEFDVNARDARGTTALMSIVGNAGRFDALEKMRMLIKRGADVNARDKASRTPLHLAISDANEPEVKLLLDYCANPLIEDTIWNILTPLATAKVSALMAVDPTRKAAAQRILELVQNAAVKFAE